MDNWTDVGSVLGRTLGNWNSINYIVSDHGWTLRCLLRACITGLVFDRLLNLFAGPCGTVLVLAQILVRYMGRLLAQILAGSWETMLVLAQILVGPWETRQHWLGSWLVPGELGWYWLRSWLDPGLVLAQVLAGSWEIWLVV